MKWHEPAIPRCAVQVFCIDYDHRLLLLHRGPKIRSARNVWSFPTGLHDIGERIHECAARAELISVYENIAGDADSAEQYHWVMMIVGVLVQDCTKAQNLEPDKHDDMRYVDMYMLGSESFFNQYKFHDSLRDHVKYFHRNIIKGLERLLQ
jgi:ADP-ribose pyrophosphatase YjhB (NUDIX family)